MMNIKGLFEWVGSRGSMLAALLLAMATATGCTGDTRDTDDDDGDSAKMLYSSSYSLTQYPIVLCHGMAGFDSLFGVVDYFHGIESALVKKGAEVYVTQVPAFGATEDRGEALLQQVEDIAAISGHAKVNLIGHSHGGLDVRYVAAVRPDLVASVTSVGSPHQGAELATLLRNNINENGVVEGSLGFLANSLGTVLGLLSGYQSPQDAVASLEALSGNGMAAFNASYPAGLPTTQCGDGPAQQGGIAYYSWSGTGVFTNVFDISDAPMGLTSIVYSESNDGLVGRCSSHLGDVLRDNYKMNHLDEVNQLFGLTALFHTNPKSVFRSHANRLSNAGL